MWILRYWKPLLALALCVGLLCLAYWAGYSRAADRAKAEHAETLAHMLDRIKEEQAINAAKDEKINRLLRVKPAQRVREVMREVSVDCELPDAVHDSLLEAVANANKPAG